MDNATLAAVGIESGLTYERLIANNFDPGAARPYIGEDGRSYITNHGSGETHVLNAQATLRKYEWISFDNAVLAAAKNRLSAVNDLRSAGLTVPVAGGMGKTTYEYETQSDITAASIGMDPIEQGNADRPEYVLKAIPLPVVFKDFNFTARQLAASRNGGSPLDTTTAELAGRKVAELLEDLVIGNSTFSYGGNSVQGYTNYSSRLTGSLTAPTTANHLTTVSEVLGMRQALYNKFHRGPYILYCSPAWDQYLDEDFSAAKGENTLRERLQKISGITAVRTLDNLSDTSMVLVEMNSDVVRMLDVMPIQTIQYESHGGMQMNFKVMGIQVPLLRADQSGNTGIAHYTV